MDGRKHYGEEVTLRPPNISPNRAVEYLVKPLRLINRSHIFTGSAHAIVAIPCLLPEVYVLNASARGENVVDRLNSIQYPLKKILFTGMKDLYFALAVVLS